MKTKIFIVSFLAIVFAITTSVRAVSQNNGAGTSNQVQQQTQTTNQGEGSQIQVENNERDQNENESADQVQEQNRKQATSTVRRQDQINAEEHRSTVADFVKSLLQTADREGGIGQQVRVIAQQQNQSASTTVQAMEKLQTRSKIKTFFFGSDYKNLGSLRSEMVQTENRLEQLNRLMENVQNEGDKTELRNQIKILEQEQTKIESFVKAQEGTFNLFGWFVKLFNK